MQLPTHIQNSIQKNLEYHILRNRILDELIIQVQIVVQTQNYTLSYGGAFPRLHWNFRLKKYGDTFIQISNPIEKNKIGHKIMLTQRVGDHYRVFSLLRVCTIPYSSPSTSSENSPHFTWIFCNDGPDYGRRPEEIVLDGLPSPGIIQSLIQSFLTWDRDWFQSNVPGHGIPHYLDSTIARFR